MVNATANIFDRGGKGDSTDPIRCRPTLVGQNTAGELNSSPLAHTNEDVRVKVLPVMYGSNDVPSPPFVPRYLGLELGILSAVVGHSLLGLEGSVLSALVGYFGGKTLQSMTRVFSGDHTS
ncbi:hypothetical protein GRX01_04170 [Halobaculum sp. WSA2]|uniref:Uncharacterized protein n=1 Tax=Halobaculum saliterrae TaxID=2073113 RepID=A0A6B0SVA2_9EURY|nr:hypothetical protein [Halobaculum saliterrae]MXR40543.1 hypothetical protein [Halobaculum saliterrae]